MSVEEVEDSVVDSAYARAELLDAVAERCRGGPPQVVAVIGEALEKVAAPRCGVPVVGADLAEPVMERYVTVSLPVGQNLYRRHRVYNNITILLSCQMPNTMPQAG